MDDYYSTKPQGLNQMTFSQKIDSIAYSLSCFCLSLDMSKFKRKGKNNHDLWTF